MAGGFGRVSLVIAASIQLLLSSWLVFWYPYELGVSTFQYMGGGVTTYQVPKPWVTTLAAVWWSASLICFAASVTLPAFERRWGRVRGVMKFSATAVGTISGFGLLNALFQFFWANSLGPAYSVVGSDNPAYFISDARPSQLAFSFMSQGSQQLSRAYGLTLGRYIPSYLEGGGFFDGQLWNALLFVGVLLACLFALRLEKGLRRAMLDVITTFFAVALLVALGVWIFDPAFWTDAATGFWLGTPLAWVTWEVVFIVSGLALVASVLPRFVPYFPRTKHV